MNNIQGLVPIDGFLSNQAKLSVEPAAISLSDPSKFTVNKIDIDGNTLVKNILFVCDKCEGPLAPSSHCIVCKRTSTRRCTSCGIVVPNGPHQSCEYLVFFRNLKSNFQDNKSGKKKI